MEENHVNEIQILETSVEEKEKYIANLEGKIIALEESKRTLEVEKAQIHEQSIQNENLIIRAAEEKIENIESALLDRDIEGLQIEEDLLNAEIEKKYAAEQDSRARSDKLIDDLESFVNNMKPPKLDDDQPMTPGAGVTPNGNHATDPSASSNTASAQKWSKLKALIIFGFAASVMTTFSDEITNLSNELNTQIKDLVGLDLHENGMLI